MTDKEIEQIAIRVADLVLDGILQQADGVYHSTDELEEQNLLTQLASAMTELDYNLEKENYNACEKLKRKIQQIENKLNKFK